MQSRSWGQCGDSFHASASIETISRCVPTLPQKTCTTQRRGWDASTGDFHTFGVVESRDISHVIDELEHRNLIVGHIGVWGMSYGASVAIESAGIDHRIKAVVALAGFSSMRSVVAHVARTQLSVATVFMSDHDIEQVMQIASRQAGFDPDDADAVAAIRRTNAQVLIVHGELDAIVPVEHAHRLHAAARDHSELLLIPHAGHVGIWFDLDGRVATQTAVWFDRWL